MARSTDEWIGKNDNTPIPARVRVRVFDSAGGCCYICRRKISAGEYWQADHVIALVNGGSNRESNLSPACGNCCYRKSADDVAEKSKVYKKRSKHLGIRKKSRFPGSRDSKFKKKITGEVVRR